MREALTFTVLTCGGTDPLAGAGVFGDLATFRAHGVHGTAVVTAVTAQAGDGVAAVEPMGADLVRAQLDAVWGQAPPRAVKTGMLAHPETARVVAEVLEGRGVPLVVDPVLAATAGGLALAGPGLLEAIVRRLAPLAWLLTPNRPEAEALVGRPIEPGEEPAAAEALQRRLQAAVLLKGGHAAGPVAVDWLATGTGLLSFGLPRVATSHGHGSGCALSASIAVRLARGVALPDAVAGAKAYLHRALAQARGLGAGRGPVCHDVAAEGGPEPVRSPPSPR